MAVRKQGKLWIVDFYVNGQRVRKTAPTRKLGVALEREAKAAEFRGEVAAVLIGDPGLFEFIDRYVELVGPTKTESTQKLDGYILNHIREHFGDQRIRKITTELIEGYKTVRASKVKPTTVNRELDLLKGLLECAKIWGYLKINPASLVRRFKVDVEEPRFVTVEEGRRLIESATGQMRTFISVALKACSAGCSGSFRAVVFGRWVLLFRPTRRG